MRSSNVFSPRCPQRRFQKPKYQRRGGRRAKGRHSGRNGDGRGNQRDGGRTQGRRPRGKTATHAYGHPASRNGKLAPDPCRTDLHCYQAGGQMNQSNMLPFVGLSPEKENASIQRIAPMGASCGRYGEDKVAQRLVPSAPSGFPMTYPLASAQQQMRTGPAASFAPENNEDGMGFQQLDSSPPTQGNISYFCSSTPTRASLASPSGAFVGTSSSSGNCGYSPPPIMMRNAVTPPAPPIAISAAEKNVGSSALVPSGFGSSTTSRSTLRASVLQTVCKNLKNSTKVSKVGYGATECGTAVCIAHIGKIEYDPRQPSYSPTYSPEGPTFEPTTSFSYSLYAPVGNDEVFVDTPYDPLLHTGTHRCQYKSGLSINVPTAGDKTPATKRLEYDPENPSYSAGYVEA